MNHSTHVITNNLLIALLLMIIGAVFVATMDVIAKLLSTNLPLAQIVWGRFFFHTLLMTPILWMKKQHKISIQKQNWKGHFTRGIFILLSTIFYFAAIKNNPIPDVIAIFFIEPIFVIFLAAIFLKEKLYFRRLLAGLVSFLGVLIILRPGQGVYTPSILLALLSGLAFASYIVATRISSLKISTVVTAWGAAIVALIFSSPWAFVVWRWPSFQEWMLLLIMGACAAIGHWAITFACRLADASIVALFHYSEIIIATILSYLIFTHAPDIWVWIGFIFIAGSKIVITILEIQKKYSKNRLK